MMQQKRSFPIGISILLILAILGLVLVVRRFLYGLGAVSNLSDGRPWGFWISFDLYTGVALAAGGFTMAGAVYIFNLKKYHPVVRPAILTAFLGYILVILALLVDIGAPWYIWHPMIYQNWHSPLLEVALAVMTYTLVLALEFSPAVFERLNWHAPMRVIRAIQIPLVVAGIAISTGHQSSLGTMLLLMPEALHPLWYTPILPILFLTSAIAVGPAVVILESTLSSKVFGHKLGSDVLSGLAKAISYILGLYLVLKIADLAVRGDLGLIFSASPVNLLWWGEMIIGVILPMIIFFMPGVRQSSRGIFVGALLVILGLIFNRFNVSMLALAIRPGYAYSPHWMEVGISAGLVAWALLVIWLAFRFLPIASNSHKEAPV
ncbi:MAG: Ni/Fe-hydrogenase cytochrome b subunit [Dehalococcoidales bacterium]|nr:Ni/Fe-hydrogenase cytochrome b subunit [Dehalococcoidales bacterium]